LAGPAPAGTPVFCRPRAFALALARGGACEAAALRERAVGGEPRRGAPRVDTW